MQPAPGSFTPGHRRGSGRRRPPHTAGWGPCSHLFSPVSRCSGGALGAGSPLNESGSLESGGHHRTSLGTNVLRGLSHQAALFSTFDVPSCIDPTLPRLRARVTHSGLVHCCAESAGPKEYTGIVRHHLFSLPPSDPLVSEEPPTPRSQGQPTHSTRTRGR